MVKSPVGLGTKNDCAGEGQQQFTRVTGTELVWESHGGMAGISLGQGRWPCDFRFQAPAELA
jgi:hypothetical protein